MNIYFNGNDWVVAESAEDAMKVWNEYVGDNWVEDGYGTIDDWEMVPPDEEFAISQEENPKDTHMPDGATIQHKPEQHRWTVITTAQKWVEKNGRGWLCSLEW